MLFLTFFQEKRRKAQWLLGFTDGMSENMSETRRNVILGAGASGLVVVLAACGGSDATDTEPAAGSGGAQAAGPGELVPASDIPVKGGKVFKDHGLVVTQPEAGTFKAFSAICPHQGCMVGEVADGVINCPCHGSEFSDVDGSVKKGPATKPLAEKKIVVSGDQITLS